MKTKILFFAFGLVACILNAQTATDKKMTWDYPLKPGMEEWNQLRTEQERINAVQVPEDILEKLTSEEVVRLIITFPLFGDFRAFSTLQNDGFSVMLRRFNIFGHLLSLKDVGKSLVAAYKDADMTGFRTLPYSNEYWTIKLDYLELVLVQKTVLQHLTSGEKLELLEEARIKFSEKINNEAFATLPGIQPSIRIMAGILDLEEHQEFKLSSNRQKLTSFIQTGKVGEASLIDEIVRMTDHYIHSKKQIQ